MISYTLFAVALGIGGIFSSVWHYQAKYRKGRLCGVTLPPDGMEDTEVESVRAEFRRSSLKAMLFLLAVLAPFFFSREYFAVNYAYFFVWLMMAFLLSSRPFILANRALKRIKRERGWSSGSTRLVQADLRVSRDKERGALPLAWFLLPLIPAVLLLVHSAQTGQIPVLLSSTVSILMTLLSLMMTMQSRRLKARVYHSDSSLNLELRQKKLHVQSLFWLLLALFEAVFSFLFAISIEGESNGEGAFPLWGVLMVAVPVLLLIFFLRYWEAVKNRVLPEEREDASILLDEDDYWVDGLYYCNPDNPAVFVEDRTGFGTTVNFATRKGRAILKGSLGLTVFLVLGAGILIGVLDSVPPRMELHSNGKVRIDYPVYSYSFDLDQVKSVSLTDSLPRGKRTNGLGTDQTARGNFRLDGWGRSKVYIYRNNPPYLVVELSDMHVVFNKKNPQETRELYASLRAAWKDGK
ncbi:DUF5808 domain-containing protein [Gorillibacterium timonense]|uniref:DUF5808 domain-containing protein n=1 Tax=Gorillibacterium timonense TaxID=1689269 RepID=UPI00071DD1EC|nr:DUF5808 domain-containing protein [Gorillibacterium timonense]